MYIFILLMACLKVAHLTNSISSRAVPWTTARNQCTLVVPELMKPGDVNFDIPIINGTANTTLAWIGRYISYSKWIEFEGCFDTVDDFDVTAFDISKYNDNRILRCHNQCPGNYFGVTERVCKCFTETTRYRNIPSLCKTNFREERNGGVYGISGCICKYAKSDVMFAELNDGNCLSIIYFQPRPTPVNMRCNSLNKILGITGIGRGSFKLLPGNGSWMDAVEYCQSNRSILPTRTDFDTIQPLQNVTYWLNTFRIQIYENKKLTENTPNLCLALRISGNRGIGTEIRKCSEELPSVCTNQQTEIYGNEDDFPHIIMISIVAGMCVIVCVLSLVIGILWHKKYRRHKLLPHSGSVSVHEDAHEYHDIELNTMDDATNKIYNRLHDTPIDYSVAITSVYDHVQNPDYDQMPKHGKAAINDDSTFTEYDHCFTEIKKGKQKL